ncbi:hypothetical protein BGW39_000641 [Mortierella sp. 14UC]|nr:hypothetical protein BGW39_000641 [Mortierella sp. 14UC]
MAAPLPTTEDGYIDTAALEKDTLAQRIWDIDEQLSAVESIDDDSDFSEFSTTSSTSTRDIQREWDENMEQGRQLFAMAPLASYALSFLPTFPQHNRQVVGYISHHPEASDLQIKPNKFTENEAFNSVLHAVIQKNLADDPLVQSVLQQQLEGWTHIADYRNPAPYGRIPLPEDIFGSVQIVDGVIQPDSYQRMPSHRIVSSLGLFQLSDYLHERLVHHLKNL